MVKGLLHFKSQGSQSMSEGELGLKGRGRRGMREKCVAELEENMTGKSNSACRAGTRFCCAAKPHLPGQVGAGPPPS